MVSCLFIFALANPTRVRSLTQRFEAFHRPHSDDWVVRLKSPQPSDDGEYQCQVSTTPHRTAKIFLTVQGESS